MRQIGSFLLILLALGEPLAARRVIGACGTTAETAKELLFLHRQSRRSATKARPMAAAVSNDRDIGNIAVIEDRDGVVARQNEFNLDLKSILFTPTSSAATAYRYSVSDFGYDSSAASRGGPLSGLDDDDSRLISLPFDFRFYGVTYRAVYVNSDGNLTFGVKDDASADRSLGRVTSGPPRIAPLFHDSDPSRTTGGVRVLTEAGRVVVSWDHVPEWGEFSGSQTFQVKLYVDGRIEFSYSGASPTEAVVGIAPGALKGTTSLVDFRNDPSEEYSGAVAERFGNDLSIDIVTTAQRFYESHEDAYDYLVIYNNMDIEALSGAVAYESTVRSHGSGWGVDARDDGAEFGSSSRLRAMLNMGPTFQYPLDPTAIVPRRSSAHDTPVTTIAHEAGHLFLAFASVTDPTNTNSTPMLGYQGAHWSFLFNSEASLLEGERIADHGAAVSPRFQTVAVTEAYSPLDRYLMGFAPPATVAPTFYVSGPDMGGDHPAVGVSFNGTRHDVTIADLMQAVGPRIPDSTVAQRSFRFAFILVVPTGSQVTTADTDRIDTYRRSFEAFFAQASGNLATADTSLKRSLNLSLQPAAGVLAGTSGVATLSIAKAGTSSLTINLSTPTGNATAPSSVTITAGSTTASFPVTGVRSGVEEISATAVDPAFETARARVQVADGTLAKIVAVSGDRQIPTGPGPLPEPIVVRLTDRNDLPYPGISIGATASAGGSVTPASLQTDGAGIASFTWSPGTAPVNTLRFAPVGLTSPELTVSVGGSVPVVTAVVNGASWAPGVAAGAIQTLTGVNLADGITAQSTYPWPLQLSGVKVAINGNPVPVLYASDVQINFLVPESTALGAAQLEVTTPSGARATIAISVAAYQPGIFPGAVVLSGTLNSAMTTPVKANDFLEIYCTGLGPTRNSGGLDRTTTVPNVFIGGIPVTPTYSGLAPGWTGLYQVNVRVPFGLSPGAQTLSLSSGTERGNEVQIVVQ